MTGDKVFFSLKLSCFLLLAVSCAENSPPVADFIVDENIDEITLLDNSSDKDDDPLNYEWSTNSSKIVLSNTSLSQTSFRIPKIESPLDIKVKLRVSDFDDEVVVEKSITVPALTEARTFGLGKVESRKVTNDVKNEWYIDQVNTGPHSALNCGPTSVTMAIRWADSLFTGTPQDARSMYHPSGGWWYTNDILGYLNYHSVNNYVLSLNNMNILTHELDKGNIAILCLDMYLIRDEIKDRWRIDKFYVAGNAGWGHFIVVKGYRIIDGKLLFEAYDPYGFRKTNEDGSPKGKNRYYRGEDIDISTGKWWDYTIIVSKDARKGAGALDPSTVPVKYGGY